MTASSNGLSAKEAYDLAIKMFQREHDRWVQNALVLLGALVSIFALSKVPNTSGYLLLDAWAVNGTAIVVIMAMRASTHAWRKTIKEIESHRRPDISPFDLFECKLHEWSYWRDFMETCIGWLCRKKYFFSVTRAYARLAWLAFGYFTLELLPHVWSHVQRYAPCLCRH
jgi:hypothetical protein